MSDLAAILSFVTAVIGLVITALTYILKFIKSEKARKVAEQAIKIGTAILPCIEQAEKFANYKGQQKKEFVVSKMSQFAAENNITFDEKFICDKIEEIIAFTKKVNNSSVENEN